MPCSEAQALEGAPSHTYTPSSSGLSHLSGLEKEVTHLRVCFVYMIFFSFVRKQCCSGSSLSNLLSMVLFKFVISRANIPLNFDYERRQKSK